MLPSREVPSAERESLVAGRRPGQETRAREMLLRLPAPAPPVLLDAAAGGGLGSAGGGGGKKPQGMGVCQCCAAVGIVRMERETFALIFSWVPAR